MVESLGRKLILIHLRHVRERVHFGSNKSANYQLLNARLNILPDPAFLDLKSVLSERLERIAGGLQPEQFASLLDPSRHVVKAIVEC